MRTWIALFLVTATLAGCTDNAPVEEPGGGDGLDLQATESTGVIRGVVVDDAIRPVIGAAVSIRGTAGTFETQTNEDGAFGFQDLEPGAWFITVTMDGFFQATARANVVASEDLPDVVKIQLERNPEETPYVQSVNYAGFIECTSSFLVLCGIPNLLSPLVCDETGVCLGNNITNDRFTPTFYYDPGALWVQTELVWDSSQSLSPDLYFEMEALDDGCDGNTTFLANAEGPSPIFASANQTVLDEADISGERCGIYHSVFSGGAVEDPVVGIGVGATVQQEFQFFSHAFYNFLPEEGWRFTNDGDPQVPT